MSTLPFIKADISRWVSGGAILSIVKYGALFIAPVALLYTYGKVQATGRAVAEQRVEQLTVEAGRLNAALEQVENFERGRQIRERQLNQSKATLAGDTSAVLDMPAPDSVVDILRPVLGDPADSHGP